jgi:hypothetical protein
MASQPKQPELVPRTQCLVHMVSCSLEVKKGSKNGTMQAGRCKCAGSNLCHDELDVLGLNPFIIHIAALFLILLLDLDRSLDLHKQTSG